MAYGHKGSTIPKASAADNAEKQAAKRLRRIKARIHAMQLREDRKRSQGKPAWRITALEARAIRCSAASREFIETNLAATETFNGRIIRPLYADVVFLLSRIIEPCRAGETDNMIRIVYESPHTPFASSRMAVAVGAVTMDWRDGERRPLTTIDEVRALRTPQAALTLALLGICDDWSAADRTTRAGYMLRRIVDYWRSR